MEQSHKEKRIRSITQLYYSRDEIKKAIFDFSKNREVVPRYFEGFGKRPDCFQYPNDIFELVKKGATSFHCSEEIWEDPLKIETGMDENQLNELRTGWDLVIDIDSKYIDYSKISAELIIELLKFHRVQNIGIKFSGSKGFHIIVPWKAFPKEINQIKTKDMFPEWPRTIIRYLTAEIEQKLIDRITDLQRPSKYVRDVEVSKQVLPDLVAVSPRHLFRTPYSLHEKTGLASVVIDKNKISKFQLTDADPMKAKPKNFMPEAVEGEAIELLTAALDWNKEHSPKQEKKDFDFKPIKLSNLSEAHFPPCIQKILSGLSDGRQRAIFILINFFRSIGMDKEELEQRLEEWNKKNKPPLKQGILKTQLSFSYRKKPIMPPNCKEYYQGIGVCEPDNFCSKIKNPVNYTVRKNRLDGKNKKKK